MYEALLTILLALFAWIAWRNPLHGLFVLCAALPSYLLRFDLIGLPTTLLEACILIQCAATLWDQRHARFSWKKLSGWMWPIGCLLLAATIGIMVSPNLHAALGVWKAYFLEPIAIFFVAITLLPQREEQERAVLALVFGGLMVSLLTVAQYLTQIGIPAPWDIERRATGIFPYPNALGLYLGPLLAIAGVMWHRVARHKNLRESLFWGSAFVLMFVAVVLSKSEAVWISAPAALFVLSLFSSARTKTIPLMAACVIALSLSPVADVAVQKITLQDASGLVRIGQWKEATVLLKTTPVFGAGLSGYPTAVEPFHKLKHIEIFQYPHNILLNFWVEIGLLGLFALGWLAIRILRDLRPIRKHPMAILPLAAFTQMAIHGLVDVPYLKNDLALLTWILLAIAFASTHTSYVRKT